MKHPFTDIIMEILAKTFGDLADEVFEKSHLIQYLNIKTKSANSGSKTRGSFANHYALYVLIEDYIQKGFLNPRKGKYSNYEGARYTDLLRRQRELPFGAKLQNHALNARLNDEFQKYFPTLDIVPILRDLREQKYWINENLITVEIIRRGKKSSVNIAKVLLEIIDAYIETKKSAFDAFLEACKHLSNMSGNNFENAFDFVNQQLSPNADARIFEIVSFAILKAHYEDQSIYWGWSADELQQDFLILFKTGRTNANDGGIDFVMKPLGRFFQVTETIDVNKYFLDIDKIQRYPLTFVVKTTDTPDVVREQLRSQAKRKYGVAIVVTRYLKAVEEIINIPMLISMFSDLVRANKLSIVMDEVITQSRIEFNYEEDGEEGNFTEES